jgi:uncharacterized membrane protein YgcG
MLVVAIDYCRVFHLTQTVETSAQNAALYAAGVSSPDPDNYQTQIAAAQQAALDEGSRLSPPLTASNVSVSVNNNVATATVTYSFATITRIPGLPSTMTVTRTVQVPVLPTNPGYVYIGNTDASNSSSGSSGSSGGSGSSGSSGSSGGSGSGGSCGNGLSGLLALLNNLANKCNDDHSGCGRGCCNNGHQCDDSD